MVSISPVFLRNTRESSNILKSPQVYRRKQVSKFPGNYPTKPTNNFMLLIFIIFHHILGFIILEITSKLAVSLLGKLIIILTQYFPQTKNLSYTKNYLLFCGGIVKNSICFCFSSNDDFIKKIISAKMVTEVK